MKTFTIDAENNITVFATKKEAAAGSTTPFDSFSNQSEFAELTAEWPVQRLVEIWNGIPGVNAITKFTSRKIATERIWKAIQNLGERPTDTPAPASQAEEPGAATPATAPAPEVAAEKTSESGDQPAEVALPEVASDSANEQPAPEATQDAVVVEETLGSVGAQAPNVAPAAAEPSNETTPAKKAPKAKKAAKAPKSEAAPREGSKTAQVVAMLQRKGGATLVEIMDKMGWQKHTVRGFMAGAMKKAGYTVESFRPEGGERTYRINP